jgi:hypothetical protein
VIEAVIRDAYVDADMVVLTMTKESCPWLTYKPRAWRSG